MEQAQFYNDYKKVSVMMLADFIRAYQEDVDDDNPFTFEGFIEDMARTIKSYHPDFDDVTFINDCNGW